MESIVSSEFILLVYIISLLIWFPCNLIALCAFSVKIHSKPVPTDILLLTLTVSDLLFLIILPLKMHEAASGMKWNLPNFMCSITSFTFFSIIYNSSFLLMAVSVVRYIGDRVCYSYHQLHKPLYAIVISAVIWLISAAHCSITHLWPATTPVCAMNSLQRSSWRSYCLYVWSLFFVLCLIPLLICIYCYLRCILILYSRPRISQMQKQKAIGMALGTLAVFLIFVLPYNLSHIVGYFQGQSLEWRWYTLLLSCFNTCIDPIIFYFSSSIFRFSSEKFIFRKWWLIVSRGQGHHL